MPIHPKPYLASITPYVGGKSKAAGYENVIKLSSNENPFGPSPGAIAAYQMAAATLHRYPEDGAMRLREAIGAAHGLDPARIICGYGSDDVLEMLVHAFAGPGDDIIFTEHGFAMYRIFTQQFGATPVAVPETELTADVAAILAAVTAKTRLVFLANPNNPTGTYIPGAELKTLRDGLRDDIVLVVDGAYHEYVDAPDYTDGTELINAGTNTIVTRTFSKIYGLPALRLGWGYSTPEIIQTLYKVRSPFNVTQPAIEAAIAALADRDHLARSASINREERDRLVKELSALGLKLTPSQANFLLLHFPDTDGKRASDANAHLLKKGIIPREVANYALPHCLRVTVGTPQENTAFLTALKEFVT